MTMRVAGKKRWPRRLLSMFLSMYYASVGNSKVHETKTGLAVKKDPWREKGARRDLEIQEMTQSAHGKLRSQSSLL